MTDVFISYSRRDKVFTQKLYEALKGANRVVWADWDSIPASSDWDAEIKEGIEKTESVLFLLSPEWIKSNECRKELNHAVTMGKRLFPILYMDVDAKEVPPELAKINWVYMRATDDFDKAFQTLCSAMDTDLEWVKSHTRIQVRALEWDKKNRDNSFALHGKDLADGEQFIAGAAQKSPEPTPLQGEYVLASRKDANRRQRLTLTGVTIALIVSVALGIAAFFQRQAAVASEATAVIAKNTAVAAESTAVSAKATAVANEQLAIKQANISRSQVLAINSTLNKDKFLQNLLLGIESFNLVKDYPHPDRIMAEQALRDSLAQVGGIPLSGHEENILDLAFSPDGVWLATGSSDKTARLWNVQDPSADPIVLRGHEDGISVLTFSPDGQWLATGSCENNDDGTTCAQGVVRLWNIKNLSTDPIVLRGLEYSIYTLAFSPDGQWLASGSYDSTIRLWDVRNPSADPIVLNDSSFPLAFSPDGQWLATGGTDYIARLWNLQNPSADPIFLPDQGFDVNGVDAIAFSPDGQWLAISGCGKAGESSCEGGEARLLDMQNPSAGPIILHSNEILFQVLDFSPDSQWLLTGSAEGNALLWNVKKDTTNPIVLDANFYYSAFSPDSHWLSNGGAIWDMQNPIADPITLSGHQGGVRTFAFSPNSQWLGTGGEDGIVRLWDIKDLWNIKVHSPSFSPDGQWLATRSCGKLADDNFTCQDVVRLWNMKNPAADPFILGGLESNYFTLAFSPKTPLGTNGQWLVINSCAEGSDIYGCFQGEVIRLWNLQNPSADPIILRGLEGGFGIIAFSPSGQWLATGGCGKIGDDGYCTQGEVRLWDMQNPTADPIVLREPEGILTTLGFSPDGQWLATGSCVAGDYIFSCDQGAIRLWNMKNLTADPIILSGHEDSILTLTFSPDSQWLATGSYDATARLWNMKDPPADPIILRGHDFRVSTLAFSPDGQWLATGGGDSIVRLWEVQNPSVDPILLQNEITISTLAFSPDGQWLATGSYDNTTRLWDLQNPTVNPIVLRDHENYFTTLFFNPDSQWPTSGSYANLLKIACQVVGRNFTRAEWASYFPTDEYRKTCEQWALEAEVTSTPTVAP